MSSATYHQKQARQDQLAWLRLDLAQQGDEKRLLLSLLEELHSALKAADDREAATERAIRRCEGALGLRPQPKPGRIDYAARSSAPMPTRTTFRSGEGWGEPRTLSHPPTKPRDTSPHKGRGEAPPAIPAVNRVAG